jgi:N-acetylglutamate synthase
MIRRFEEISNNAWPALQTLQYDGWILRFANGVTKRSNSVNPLYPSTIDPDKKISYCEHLYASRNIPVCFKVTAGTEPPDLDHKLASRGYSILSNISFQTMTISKIPPEPIHEVNIDVELKPHWIDEFIRMNEFDAARKTTYMSIMNQVYLPKCMISLVRNNQTIGVGLGVVEGNFIGLFDIVVDKAYRNTGLGYLIVENILRWGRKQGADTAYLQVLTNNFPAIRLYDKLGFKEAYQYWYRVKI